ncbi:hypothetical protein LPJ53_000860 [Coemansia erecta]|uniref:Uncharacterized protein n=1 Tax=Coemansia erecta TaxID=147472 RepID=A0A9W7Y162_9FUNG|nr:hypothetical protein LPJ53_000860 [Coemansia erecta]
MSSYSNNTGKRGNAYDTAGDDAQSAYLDQAARAHGDSVHVQTMGSPSIDITSMSQPQQQQQQRYMPYAGAYSESAWGNAQPAGPRDSMVSTGKPKASSSLDMPAAAPPPHKPEYYDGSSHSFVGFRRMSRWNAVRFIFYVTTRLAQLIVAIVCMAYLANSRHTRADDAVDTTERRTEVAVFVVGGVTAVTALISIVLHLFGRTRERIEKSRLAWVTMSLNFLVFVTWIILVLINVVVVDCSRKADGGWCRDIKVSSATGLVSAMLALVVVLRSFSVLVRVGRINLFAKP